MMSRMFVAALALAMLAGCTTYDRGYRHYAVAHAGHGDYYYEPAPAPRYFAAPAYVHYPAYYSLYWGFDRHYYSPWYRPHFHYGVTWFPNDWFAFSVVHRYPYHYWHPYAPYRYSAWDHRFAWYHYTPPRHRYRYREPRFGHPNNERQMHNQQLASERDVYRQRHDDAERGQRRFTRSEPSFQEGRAHPPGPRSQGRGAPDPVVQPQRTSVSRVQYPGPQSSPMQPQRRATMRDPREQSVMRDPARVGDAPQARMRAHDADRQVRGQQAWQSQATSPARRDAPEADMRRATPVGMQPQRTLQSREALAPRAMPQPNRATAGGPPSAPAPRPMPQAAPAPAPAAARAPVPTQRSEQARTRRVVEQEN